MAHVDRDHLAYFLSKLKLWVASYAPSKDAATPYSPGLMSAADKAKLDGVATDADLNAASANPVRNSAVTQALQALGSRVTDLEDAGSTTYTYKGSVPTRADLPASGNQVGDVYDVLTAPDDGSWAWNGTAWNKLSGFVDLSNLATRDVATPSSDGLMSASDKASFDALMQGFVPLWSAVQDYSSGMLIRGSDGSIYLSKQPSGPGTAALARDPALDGGTYWGKVSSDDADVLHSSGAETVQGQKTFAQPIVGDVTGSSSYASEAGGFAAWSASEDYPAGSLVRGSDLKIYYAVQASGPDSGGASNPVSDGGAHWTAFAADDSGVVHVAGAETVQGQKTFAQPVVGDVLAPAPSGGVARLLSVRASDVVNVKDYGARGDGATDDAAAINAAIAAGAGRAVYFPAGTYLTSTGVRIPSNTAVFGAGESATVIRLTSPYSCVACVTNDRNFWHDPAWGEAHGFFSYETQTANTGNEFIYLGYMTVDGNGWRQQTNIAGAQYASAVVFANVHHSKIEHVRAINGRLHGIDVCSAMYSVHYAEGAREVYFDDEFNDWFGDWTIGESSHVVLSECTGIDPRSDDCITTHYSHDIDIYAASGLFRSRTPSGTNCGLEIDDGSHRVNVFGGRAEKCRCGFSAKGHNPAIPSYDVHVYGFMSVDCTEMGFMLSHDYESPTYSPETVHPELARSVSLRDCVSVAPAGNAEYRDMGVYRMHDCVVDNFRCNGDGETPRTTAPILITENAYDTVFSDIWLYDIVLDPAGIAMIQINSQVGEGIHFRRVVATDCYGPYVINDSRVDHALSIDDLHGYASRENDTNVAILNTNLSNLMHEWTYVGGVTGTNWANDIKDNYRNTFPGGQMRHRTVVGKYGAPALYKRGISTSTVEPSPSYIQRYGVIDDAQDMRVGETLLLGFEYKSADNDVSPQVVGYVGMKKDGPAVSWGLVFGTCYDLEGGLSEKWEIYSPGNFMPSVTDAYDIGRWSNRVHTIYLGTGGIDQSDARMKDDVESVPEALMRAWGRVRFVLYRLKSAKAEKGDAARVHAGVLAQEVRDAFAAEGLDASRYGVFCHDVWDDEWEDVQVEDRPPVVDGNGLVVEPAVFHTERRKVRDGGEAFGIRYEEALVLECAYQRWLGERRDAEIAALKARLGMR